MQVRSLDDAVRLSRSGRPAGAGVFSKVVVDDIDPNIVHKIGLRDDHAYRAYVEKLALKNQHNPAVPRIYEYKTWPLRDGGRGRLRPNPKKHYVRMEALQHVQGAPLSVRQRAVDLLILSYDDKTIAGVLREYPHDWFKEAWRPVKTREELARRVSKEQPFVSVLLTKLNKVIRDTGYANDLHDNNMMWRPSTGDIVITDPFYD